MKGKHILAIIAVFVLLFGIISACGGGGSSAGACGHASCQENGPFYCMGKNNTCNNRTYCAYDYYCDSCD